MNQPPPTLAPENGASRLERLAAVDYDQDRGETPLRRPELCPPSAPTSPSW
ncbi:hypothetical protein ACIQZO_34975 [Streptomyces sp. NPDC097617]|uniref:hypothetical protein n=1 Tax=Streptomyces sp. NPDC097617 TaxID=3366091 RepID=UPI003819F253